MKVAIVNTIQDALHLLKSHQRKDNAFQIFTTHDVVQDFLEAKKINAHGLMEVLDEKQIASVAEFVRREMPPALRKLDEKLSEQLSSSAKIPAISWFTSAYRYFGEHELFGLMLAHEAIRSIISRNNPENLLLYNPGLSPYLGEKFGFAVLVKILERTLPVKITAADKRHPSLPQLNAAQLPWRLKLGNSFNNRVSIFTAQIRNHFNRSRHICIAFQERGDWPWTEKKFPLSLVPLDAIMHPVNQATLEENLFDACDNYEFKDEQPGRVLLASTLRGVKENLRKNYINWAACNGKLQRFIESNSVRLATWKTPPVEGERALANELISTNGIQIIGSQHGGCYGIQEMDDIHRVSDYSRCNYFLSHGFKREHLSFKKKEGDIPHIIPIGRQKRVDFPFVLKRYSGGKIEILYPIGGCYSFWYGLSFARIQADILFHYQKYILDKLAKFNVKILVKLPPKADWQTFSNWERLRKSRIKIFTENCDLESVMDYYQPRNVFLDILSTPLIEVLRYDCEVFQINDPACPLKPRLHELLTKRVHLCSDAKSLWEKFKSVQSMPSMRLRDSGFYDQFVRPNSQGKNQLQNLLLEMAK